MSKMLVVEDNLTFLETLKKFIKSNFPAMVVEGAENGKEAFNLIKDRQPDLILMDIKLQNDNGLE